MKSEDQKNTENENVKESMKKIFDKYENLLKKLSDSDSTERTHKEGAD
jgi:hypothetical protein